MPRTSFRQIRATYKSPLLGPLLHATKSLEQAQNELRWIKQELPAHRWKNAVARRSRLEPLQYILGTQPFGSLDIQCRPGVLIPRWETEEWTLKLVERMKSWGALKILDVCTGSGCIALLLKKELLNAHVEAVDLSQEAIELAKKNRDTFDIDVGIHKGDLLQEGFYAQVFGDSSFDVVVSNPPYIPLEDFTLPVANNGIERSVRLYEPKMALVGHLEFYKALVRNVVIPLRCNAFVFELGYQDQADYTKLLLPPQWETATLKDSAGNLRCINGWKQPLSLEQM